MEAFAISALVVAIAEIGDRTQLLSMVLAARFRQPLPIVAGILVATLANHALAGLAGASLVALIPPEALRWIIAASFAAMAVWSLLPDRLEDEAGKSKRGHGAFLTTVGCFFIAEIGDKTQIATAILAARFSAVVPVVIGTTLGMLLANIPAVLGGHLLGDKLGLRWVRYAAAALFAVQAVLAAAGVTLW